MNRTNPYFSVFSLLLAVAISACEPTNPFGNGPTYNIEENLERDRVIIDEYLANAEIDSLYRIHHESGVIIIVQEEGEGTRPMVGSVVYTDYTGSLISDGTVFDTSFEDVARENDLFDEEREYLPIQFTVGRAEVIQGWEIGFQRLRPGSKAVLLIPSPYAYRDADREAIPPNSVLRFDVDFLGID
ncbi:FKBP-type peptidyl-prolyl cis-trans isomerase [Algoriphagus sp.]|uniref:FKBP-type peptidyl-prolyl cis-trans isomerase n=1 Tax=Algoriphagus sp. TaxID=1872435 RepID=UPI0026077673|nr:FKBP-type peptidyl-prolyl cis-trans isomerase [Algoriphagus sp.]